MLEYLKESDGEVYGIIKKEHLRQEEGLELIASENYVSQAVLEAQGSVLTNKYAEGYPGKRYYGGCQHYDEIERLAQARCKKLFNAEHVNVQPHSGTQANMAVYFSVLNPGDTIMGMHLSHGGHLSHGHPSSFSGRYFYTVPVELDCKTGLIDFDIMRRLAEKNKPKLIVAGASAYSRIIDFSKFREICDHVGAYLMADVAHIAGLIAAGIHPSPFPHADFVTTTTHKTLRGPRGGLVMCRKEFADMVDKNIFPGIQGGPLMHVIAAKAVAFGEALKPEFMEYQKQIVKNSRTLAEELVKLGFKLVTGGTDNHLMLVDLRNKNMKGSTAQDLLDEAGIATNKNSIPGDPEKPFITSGIRLGTPAVTTRGMKEEQMKQIAVFISRAINSAGNKEELKAVKKEVKKMTNAFPIYGLSE
ncbi:serine hydroxymethyltransferase [bacterium]|nr:serine hydroxymethyltransferase [Candidatus Omnitrophota bacterium]MBU2528381.1 serine hydroxymethyltransferase [bacterium]MBU3930639.1 serine hydroxymethyltransferase [bacterium]MBU4123404.1 serine hydroxymethyltransferase [bacterium]